ncbi:NlpC/P60 family protein [Henriciella sp. AS95]|uniref:NlpC/P60 family protein n=1 Tax=Henriciella sp. AS95 TaxID=3135782 RepID=UPI00316B11A3
MTRSEIVAAAREWVGTPYQHQASKRDVGTDCLGLIRGLWRHFLGAEPEEVPPYAPDWAELTGDDVLLAAARRNLIEIAPGSAREGDVLLFRMGLGCPAKHCAVMSGEQRIIHAYWGRSVCETRLVPWWSRRIVAAFSFPGLED